MYSLVMSELSVTDARAELPAAIKKSQKSPVHILKHGEPVAVLISPTLYREMLEAMEELEDIEAFDQAMLSKEKTIAWDDVKRELGLL
ncbi:MAG: type II toxin-antitoxin system prevent-host-death family antitoxin [Actinobacteria bacterium]|nr:type II toxin-antitoxin system prevent-host-death family antitoxin [Actinomycetota bacterium]